MRADLLPDALWSEAERLLPPHPPSPKGGRPRVPDPACLAALVYLLREGGHVPRPPLPGVGLRLGGDGLAAHAGVEPRRRLDGAPRAAPPAPGPRRGGRPVPRRRRRRLLPGGKRGGHTGPNPTDRRKKGCKRHVLTDRRGVPRVVHTGRADESDEKRLRGLLLWMPPVPTKARRPRRVREVLADAAHGVAWLVALVAGMGFRARLKPRGNAGKVHGSGLGKKRYVVERTMAWLASGRRLRVCYERTWCSWQGLHKLSACVFCARRLEAIRTRETGKAT